MPALSQRIATALALNDIPSTPYQITRSTKDSGVGQGWSGKWSLGIGAIGRGRLIAVGILATEGRLRVIHRHTFYLQAVRFLYPIECMIIPKHFALLPASSRIAETSSHELNHRKGGGISLMLAYQVAEVRIRRHSHVPECDVVVAVRGKQIFLRCPDYDQAVKWARVECRSYGIASMTAERARNDAGHGHDDSQP